MNEPDNYKLFNQAGKVIAMSNEIISLESSVRRRRAICEGH